MKTPQINKAKFFDYFIIIARFLLAIIFIMYGYSKLTEGQFGLSNEMLEKPIKELNLMQIGWYIFDKQPFKFFIGISQIICGILLLINRTVLIGAIIFLPIALNILIIDFTIMPTQMANAFAFRLGFYIILDLLIFYHYKDRIIKALKTLTESIKPKYKHKIWALLIIPIFAIILEFATVIPNIIWGLVSSPEKMINDLRETLNLILKLF